VKVIVMFLFIYFMVLVVIPIIKTYCTAIFTENTFLLTFMNSMTWMSEMTRMIIMMRIMMMKLMKINIEVWAHDHPLHGSQPQGQQCN